nr:MAG TPA: hypothetical protein [Caudoviricetes sp.]
MIVEFADLQQPNTASLAYVSATCKRKFNGDKIFYGDS